ncbi:hypothetical protein [Ketobacter sp.]
MKRLTPIFNYLEPFDWGDAFDKFGFDDGTGLVRTYEVAYCLERAGYKTAIGHYGIHNIVINSIKLDSIELLPLHDPTIRYGYTPARAYLPKDIIDILDKAFPNQPAPPKKFTNGNRYHPRR